MKTSLVSKLKNTPAWLVFLSFVLLLLFISCEGSSGVTTPVNSGDGRGVGIGELEYERIRIDGMDCIVVLLDEYEEMGLGITCDWEQ